MTYRPLDDFELIIDPIIFKIDVDLSLDNQANLGIYDESTYDPYSDDRVEKFHQIIAPVLNDIDADVFRVGLFDIVFGYRNIDREKSVELALELRNAIQVSFGPEINVELSFSTLGIEEYRDYYENIRHHLNDENFSEFLSGYVRYLFVEHYEYWERGDTSLLEYEDKYLKRKKIY